MYKLKMNYLYHQIHEITVSRIATKGFLLLYCFLLLRKKKEKKALLHFLLYVNTINKNDDKGDRWSIYIRIWIDIIQYKNVRKKGKKTMLGLHAAALRRVPSTFIQVKVERNDRQ